MHNKEPWVETVLPCKCLYLKKLISHRELKDFLNNVSLEEGRGGAVFTGKTGVCAHVRVCVCVGRGWFPWVQLLLKSLPCCLLHLKRNYLYIWQWQPGDLKDEYLVISSPERETFTLKYYIFILWLLRDLLFSVLSEKMHFTSEKKGLYDGDLKQSLSYPNQSQVLIRSVLKKIKTIVTWLHTLIFKVENRKKSLKR